MCSCVVRLQLFEARLSHCHTCTYTIGHAHESHPYSLLYVLGLRVYNVPLIPAVMYVLPGEHHNRSHPFHKGHQILMPFAKGIKSICHLPGNEIHMPYIEGIQSICSSLGASNANGNQCPSLRASNSDALH